MDIEALKAQLTNVMPILDANLEAAHNEYMSGYISAGAFNHVRVRHESACIVLSDNGIPVENAYQACAPLVLDLSAGLEEVDDKVKVSKDIEAFWQCYRDAGYTEVNKFFNFPRLPIQAA